MWRVKNKTKALSFETLYQVADYLGYSYSYTAQRYRRGQDIQGYTIEKVFKPKRKQYTYTELMEKVETLEKDIARLQEEFELMQYKMMKGY
ncbi:MAG: hypothetical protein MJZ34_13435 [Paludibacteraceae bacterium]|nr:hypothetical protein [Paludibacteraceae bacterium]